MTHTRYKSSGWGIGPSHRPLPDNTQHSDDTDIHAPGGIRILNPSKRAVAHQRLKPRGNRHYSSVFHAALYSQGAGLLHFNRRRT